MTTVSTNQTSTHWLTKLLEKLVQQLVVLAAVFGQPTLGAYAGDYIANKGHKLFKRITGYGITRLTPILWYWGTMCRNSPILDNVRTG